MFVFFFFQAEDGIRDLTVTGVQTCALPIFVFLGGQVIEFTEFVHKGLTMSTNLFGCTFFVLTGTHGAHVAVGVLWLLTLWVRALQGKLGPANAMTVEITGLYWHFVDVVWIIIFKIGRAHV